MTFIHMESSERTAKTTGNPGNAPEACNSDLSLVAQAAYEHTPAKNLKTPLQAIPEGRGFSNFREQMEVAEQTSASKPRPPVGKSQDSKDEITFHNDIYGGSNNLRQIIGEAQNSPFAGPKSPSTEEMIKDLEHEHPMRQFEQGKSVDLTPFERELQMRELWQHIEKGKDQNIPKTR